MQAGIFVVPNGLGASCNDLTLLNNVVTVFSARPMIHLLNFGGALTSDSNIFFNPSNLYGFWRESATEGNYWSLAGWQQGLGQDLHSLAQDPLLDVSNLFKPLAASPALDRGQPAADVPTDYSGAARPANGLYTVGAHQDSAKVPSATSY
jgi:hypothetical protein